MCQPATALFEFESVFLTQGRQGVVAFLTRHSSHSFHPSPLSSSSFVVVDTRLFASRSTMPSWNLMFVAEPTYEKKKSE